MRKNILQQLFHGEIYPFEQVVPTDPDYTVKGHAYERYMDQIREFLGEEEAKHMDNLKADIHVMELESLFACGFRLGLFLMMDLRSMEDKTI